jgi:uncharacterized protein YciI
MKTTALILVAVVGLGVFRAGAGDPPKKDREVPPGTRVYQVVLFKRGPKWGAETTPEFKQLQIEQLAYLAKLEREGKIVLAGAFTDRGLYQSMIIFKIASAADARALVAESPAVKAERLVVEMHPWMSADGIRVIPPRSGSQPKAAPKKAQPKKDTEPKKDAEPKKEEEPKK